MKPDGQLTLAASGVEVRLDTKKDLLAGVKNAKIEACVIGMQLLGNAPYRVYKNRFKGGTLDSWPKTYNNTITGEVWDYPEFKGYYFSLYGARVYTKEGDFTVHSATENLFLIYSTPPALGCGGHPLASNVLGSRRHFVPARHSSYRH